MGRGVRDDGAEGLEVEPVRGEREPETEQHPTACEAVLGRAPGSRDPADCGRAAHAAQIEPPGERADETWSKDAVAMEEESDERRGEAETAWREAVSPRLRRPFAQVRPESDLLPPVVLVEVVEDRVGVQREDPVDERRVTGEARLVPELRRDRGELGERLFVDGPSVVWKARGAAAPEQLRVEAGRAPHAGEAAGGRQAAARPRLRRATERAGRSRPLGRACRRRHPAPRGKCPAQPSRSGPAGPRRGAAARAARRARPPPARAASRATAGCCAATAPNARHRGSRARLRAGGGSAGGLCGPMRGSVSTTVSSLLAPHQDHTARGRSHPGNTLVDAPVCLTGRDS